MVTLKQRLPRWLPLMALLVASLAVSGCNYLIFAAYMVGGPPSIEPDFDVETGLSMTAKDVTVAVVCYAPTEIRYDFSRIDKDLARYVSARLYQKKIKVVSPDHINAWVDRNPRWETPAEIGEATGATYVVYLEVSKYSLYEKNSDKLYRGRSEVLVSVWKMESDGQGEQIYTRDVTTVYPLAVPRSSYDTKYTTFKREFLERLSEEIGRLFYEHYNGDDFPDAA
ncbi:MAG TPA: hypothetical protein VML55_25625 [Planctomycetaceae bacterium]|nr:hypothetical protein [Planctomycetaceae bacterium]